MFFLRRFFAIPALFLSGFLSLQANPEKIREAINEGRDKKIIEDWKAVLEQRDELWVYLEELLKKEGHSLLRRHVMRDALVAEEKINFSPETFSIVVSLETKSLLAKKEAHDDQDIEAILNLLTIIDQKNLTSNFYDVIPFTAYPLTDIRRRAYQTLAVLNDDRMYPIIMDMATSENSIERIYALDALYFIKDDRTVPLLINSLSDENKSVRFFALRTLDEMQRLEVIPQFIKIVTNDTNNEVRVKAIQVLTSMKARQAIQVIVRTLSDPDPSVKEAALRSLMEFNSSDTAYPISMQLAQEKNDHLKLLGIQALLHLKSSGGMAGLQSIIENDDNEELIVWAIYTSGVLADFRGFETVHKNLKHKNVTIRAETALALGRYGKRESANDLLAILRDKDEDYYVKSAALEAIRWIDTTDSYHDLFLLSREHKDMAIREKAGEILGDLLKKRFE